MTFFVSCQEDPFDGLKLEGNPYDNIVSPSKAIIINDINIVKYDIRSSTMETLFVKYNIIADLSSDYFENNYIFNPIFPFSPEVYVNNHEHKINIEPGTKQMYIYDSYHFFKNRENQIVFKFNIVEDMERREIASNVYRFRLN